MKCSLSVRPSCHASLFPPYKCPLCLWTCQLQGWASLHLLKISGLWINLIPSYQISCPNTGLQRVCSQAYFGNRFMNFSHFAGSSQGGREKGVLSGLFSKDKSHSWGLCPPDLITRGPIYKYHFFGSQNFNTWIYGWKKAEHSDNSVLNTMWKEYLSVKGSSTNRSALTKCGKCHLRNMVLLCFLPFISHFYFSNGSLFIFYAFICLLISSISTVDSEATR
jgi:hypothetical protein